MFLLYYTGKHRGCVPNRKFFRESPEPLIANPTSRKEINLSFRLAFFVQVYYSQVANSIYIMYEAGEIKF